MKKTMKHLAVLSAIAMALAFTGCQDDSDNNTNAVKGSTDFSKAVVGDIVLTDGTFVSASDFNSATHKAAAVIVRAKDEDKPALGVCMHRSAATLAWCSENTANAYNTNITGLLCDANGTGYSDGSNSWETLKNACGDADKGNDETLYPAWNFCNTYGTANGLTGDLATGWYMPALAELITIYNNITTIDASLLKAGGDQFNGVCYWWSCCQSSSSVNNAYGMDFSNGNTCDAVKYSCAICVCAVHQFD